MVVASNHYLAQAGPLGSTIGMVLGGLIMAVISANYAYLMNVYPSAGGAYTYASETLGIVLKQHREESKNGGAPVP